MPPVGAKKKQQEKLAAEVKALRKSNPRNLTCADCPARVSNDCIHQGSANKLCDVRTPSQHLTYAPISIPSFAQVAPGSS